MILIRRDRSTDEKVDSTEQFGECVGDNCIFGECVRDNCILEIEMCIS